MGDLVITNATGDDVTSRHFFGLRGQVGNPGFMGYVTKTENIIFFKVLLFLFKGLEALMYHKH